MVRRCRMRGLRLFGQMVRRWWMVGLPVFGRTVFGPIGLGWIALKLVGRQSTMLGRTILGPTMSELTMFGLTAFGLTMFDPIGWILRRLGGRNPGIVRRIVESGQREASCRASTRNEC